MKAVIQRVSKASVTIADIKVASIKGGLLILLGIVDYFLCYIGAYSNVKTI